MLSEIQRKEKFNKVCTDVETKVRAVHKPVAFGSFSWTAIESWASNQWNKKTSAADIKQNVGKGAVRLVAFAVSSVPLLGTLLTTGVDQALAMQHRKANEKFEPGDHETAHAFLVEHGMDAYGDALRKAEVAEREFVTKQSIGNCSDLVGNLSRFYYWKYRLERLQYYHDIVKNYSDRAAGVIDKATNQCKLAEQKLKDEMPAQLYADWTWHRNQCKTMCTFPFDTLEISGPTNVKQHVGSYVAGPNAGQAVPVVPTGHAPKLPPRTHPLQQGKKP